MYECIHICIYDNNNIHHFGLFQEKNLILIAMPFQNVQVVFRKVSMGLLKSSKLEY